MSLLQSSKFVILNRVKDLLLAWQKQILRAAQYDKKMEIRLLQDPKINSILMNNAKARHKLCELLVPPSVIQRITLLLL
jgi:hypothetical protein